MNAIYLIFCLLRILILPQVTSITALCNLSCIETRKGSAAMRLMQQFALPPDEIYRRSFATVEALLPTGDWLPEERHVLRRIVHATGDPQLALQVRFKPAAIEWGVVALQQRAAI